MCNVNYRFVMKIIALHHWMFLGALNLPMIIGNHTFPVTIKLRMAFAGRSLDGTSSHSHIITTPCSSLSISQSTLSEFKFKGLALPMRSKFHYSEVQKEYLLKIYMQGEKAGIKASPEEVHHKMRQHLYARREGWHQGKSRGSTS